VGAGGRARVLRGATVTAAGYPVAVVVCVRAKDMKEPWCLATSLANETARALINLYGKRWGIEGAFRDTKDLRFGMGGAGKGSACEAGGMPAEIPCCGSSEKRGIRRRLECFLGADHSVRIDQQLAGGAVQGSACEARGMTAEGTAIRMTLGGLPAADMRATKAASGLLFRLALRAHI